MAQERQIRSPLSPGAPMSSAPLCVNSERLPEYPRQPDHGKSPAVEILYRRSGYAVESGAFVNVGETPSYLLLEPFLFEYNVSRAVRHVPVVLVHETALYFLI